MASIRKEILIAARPEEVWDAIRDVGAIHTRLAKGFVTDTRLEGDSRLVTFSNGVVVRELIVDIDDGARRLAYAVVEWKARHHHASFQVLADGEGSRVVWMTDVLPDELRPLVDGLMEQGTAAMKQTLESQGRVISRV